MGKYPRKRRLSAEQRQALELLAGDPHGATGDKLAGVRDARECLPARTQLAVSLPEPWGLGF
jgi:hypothetical protein